MPEAYGYTLGIDMLRELGFMIFIDLLHGPAPLPLVPVYRSIALLPPFIRSGY